MTRQEMRGINRELVELVMIAQEYAGAKVKFSKKHHIMVLFPDGQVTSMPSTPSDHRARRNVRADLLRICPELAQHI